MKKTVSLILATLMLLGILAGCSGEKAPQGGFEGTMEEAVEAIYKNHKEIDLFTVTVPMDMNDADALIYNTGLDSADKITDVAVSETMMGQPYSLVLVRAKSADDAEAVAKEMFNNIDQRKWICVEADTKTAAYAGDVVMFFMINSEFEDVATTDSMLEAFEAVVGAKPTVVG